MKYRQLTEKEISRLLLGGCVAENWNAVTVGEGFDPSAIHNTRFYGNVTLGRLSGKISIEEGIEKDCGIRNCSISNCEIGDNVYLADVKDISCYRIESDVSVCNVGALITTGKSTFGNGTEIEILNEAGGRELPLFDRLSSQIAYMTVLYRHDKEFIERILSIIRSYCESKRSDYGLIESGARISDTPVIRNVLIGGHSIISGAGRLEEGTVRSCREAPVMIGAGVVARKFVILSGSVIDEGALLDKCFVGQGVRAGRQLSAENSAFFANSEAFHSEACSLFAGPYSVTHHKSTLLIASLVSFFNAGSGTNQSNHMYKLGPVHQGILERGSKTGSFSYLLLPCHLGAYSVVVGKHYVNFDSSDFPFSYITEERGRSELTPAMNLFTVGTRRDIEKWPSRDRRKDPDQLDLIHFDLFNPYIAGRIIKATDILYGLSEKAEKSQSHVIHKGLTIQRLLLKTTRKYYEMALKIYIGSELTERIGDLGSTISVADLRNRLAFRENAGDGGWLDISGMFAPAEKIQELIDSVKAGKINTVDEIHLSLLSVFNNYKSYAWTWCAGFIKKQTGYQPENLPIETLILIIEEWKTNAIKLNNMIARDAEKEFDQTSRTGFGIDGGNDERDRDFNAVRGDYERNRFVTGLQKDSQAIEEKAARLISVLEKLKQVIPDKTD
ncbi:MAG: DUF4954 family protein [Bacteroidales bacterium]|nr:DUF4954 family protein [Bacteroidales bacterium]